MPLFPNWQRSRQRLCELEVLPDTNAAIENLSNEHAHMNFGNRFVGGGVLGRGKLQEEINFLLCPELITACFLCEEMADNECITISGIDRFSSHAGYSDSFAWDGPYKPNADDEAWTKRVLTVDAYCYRRSRRNQFSQQSILRDLNKVAFTYIAR